MISPFRSALATPGGTLIFGLVMLAHVSSAVSFGSKKAVDDEKSYANYAMRARVGHFSEKNDYMGLYEQYFKNVIQKTDDSLSKLNENDWRYLRPAGEMCISFLQRFQVKKYTLNKPFDIIPLDACLGWLFEEDEYEKETDFSNFNSKTKAAAQALANDAKLKSIFESTGFSASNKNIQEVPKELREAFHKYFMQLMEVFNGNPKNGCHGMWLQSYIDFIEELYLDDCEDDIDCVYFGVPGLDKDSYISLIVESSTESSKKCYHQLQVQMVSLMASAYDEDPMPAQFTRKLKVFTNKLAKQYEKMKWSPELIKVLQLVIGVESDKPISLSDVARNLQKIKRGDQKTIDAFTKAIAEYAIQNIDPSKSAGDPEGRARFGQAMTKLCRPYIDYVEFLAQTGGTTLWDEDAQSAKKPFDFYHLVYSLVRITNHDKIFGVTKNEFEDEVLQRGWEPLYLGTFACQVISTTWAELSYETNTESYDVTLRNDAELMIIDWPINVIASKLSRPEGRGDDLTPSEEPIEPSSAEAHKANKQGKKRHLKFNLRNPLKGLIGSSGKSGDPQSVSAKEPSTAPAPAPAQTLASTQETPAAISPSVPSKISFAIPGRKDSKSRQQAKKSDPNQPVMSLESIRLFKSIHGHLPQLPDNILDIYPDLAKDMNSNDASSASATKSTPVSSYAAEYVDSRPTQRPKAVPLAFDFDEDFSTSGRFSGLNNGRGAPQSREKNLIPDVDALSF